MFGSGKFQSHSHNVMRSGYVCRLTRVHKFEAIEGKTAFKTSRKNSWLLSFVFVPKCGHYPYPKLDVKEWGSCTDVTRGAQRRKCR